MSLTKDAIQQITETALSAGGKMLPTNTPVALIPDAVSVADLERYMAGRSRFRGTFSTHSLADFVGHMIKRNMLGAKGFIDQDEMSCSLFFNIGDEISPDHADDRALLKLKPSAGYKAAQAVNGKAMTQKDMSDWIEDWHQYLTPVDENETVIAIAKAIAAVRTTPSRPPANRKQRPGIPAPAAAPWTRSRRAARKPCRWHCCLTSSRSRA